MDNVVSFPGAAKEFEKAAEWLAALDRGLNESERAEIADWLRDKPANAEALLELAELWDQLDELSELGLLFPLDQPRPARRARRLGSVGLAVAAGALAGLIGVWVYLDSGVSVEAAQVEQTPAAPEAEGPAGQPPDASSLSADVARFHAAALEALGGQDLDGIELTGAGWDACLGQAWSVSEGWARWELNDYRRSIDYERGVSTQSAMRRAELDPGRVGGCGAQPGASAAPQRSAIDAAASWPAQLPIWLTPHGFLKLLTSGNPEISPDDSGWNVTLPVTRNDIAYTLVGRFSDDHELSSIQTWIDNPIFGDMEVLAEFGGYREYEDLRFPESLTVNQGGFATLDLRIDTVTANPEVTLPADNRGRRRTGAADGQPAFTEIGNGIFAFHGGYQAVAVEFDTFAVLVDGLQSDARVRELIALTGEATPGKPIRYVISTHSHFDHASGLRLLAAEGAVIVTHAMNVSFFEQALAAPRTLMNGAGESNPAPVQVQGVDGRFEIADESGQRIEIHALGPSPHAADMLVAYLPSIRAIVEADVLQPWINPIFGGGRDGPHPYLVYLADELESASIDYESFIPIHVPPTPPMMRRSDLEAVLAE